MSIELRESIPSAASSIFAIATMVQTIEMLGMFVESFEKGNASSQLIKSLALYCPAIAAPT